jgi:hypothetical protein
MRLTLGEARTTVSSFADGDWANDNGICKSRSGYLFALGRGPIIYKFKQHTCVAQSTCEAEYHSAADVTKEGLHLHQLMREIFNAPITETTTIWEDSQSAIAYSQNALVNEKTKYTGQKWHFLKDLVEQGTIKLSYHPLTKRWLTCSPNH